MNLRHPPVRRAPARRISPRHVALSIATLLAIASATAARAETYPSDTFYVDRSSVRCWDAGPGTRVVPYCTIGGAAAAHNGPGVVLRVKPGTYHETIGAPRSGEPGAYYEVIAEPGTVLDASGLTNGVSLSGASWIKIDGFRIVNPTLDGVRISGGSHDLILRNLRVEGAPEYGIYVTNASRLLLSANTLANGAGRGIQLRDVTTTSVEDNEAFGNFIGINVTGASSQDDFRRNRLHHNATSGLVLSGSDFLCVENLCWANAEHGILQNTSTRTRHLHEVVWGNGDDGVDLKTASTLVTIENCILAENGLGHSAYDLNADTSSSVGLVSNDNVYWNSNGQKPVRVAGTTYATLTALASATGLDTRSRLADPYFLDPAAGNFHVRGDSPAIDAANSNLDDWPSADAAGLQRWDDPPTANGGLGRIPFADRGAFEFVRSGKAPIAVLYVSPAGPPPATTYTLDASSSYDLDAPGLWYWFDFGDGTRTGPSTTPAVSHTYAAGTWHPKLTVVDPLGLVGTATATVRTAQTTSAGTNEVAALTLLPVSPNPARARARFGFVLPGAGDVRLTVVDLAGRRVATVVSGVLGAGAHEASWNGRGDSGPSRAGLYFARLETAAGRTSRRFVLER